VSSLAVVCGATGGLGPAVVAAFARRGDRVVAVARSESDLGALRARIGERLVVETADLTSEASVEDLWQRIERRSETPRWLVNLTGGYRGGTAGQASGADVQRMLDLNLLSAWWSCRAAVRRLASDGGAIVNVSARSAVVPQAGAAAYAVAKAAVLKLTEVLADECKDAGVRVNAILPAIIDTPANRRDFPERAMAKAVAPESIAEVILFLCSDAAASVTGAAIPVYGRF
jgi:NAD(P)-dependent dehydrogenase (short-subunit alcohol dehydrogenase family)